jgi:hypothetical protein
VHLSRMPVPLIELHRCTAGLAHPSLRRAVAARLPTPATSAGAGVGGGGKAGGRSCSSLTASARHSSLPHASHLRGRRMWKSQPPHRWYVSLSLPSIPRFRVSQWHCAWPGGFERIKMSTRGGRVNSRI